MFKMFEESINRMKGKNNNYRKGKNGTWRVENTELGKVNVRLQRMSEQKS